MSVDKLLLSTVRIETEKSLGTGFFIGANYLLTCGHVVAGANRLSFIWKGECQDWDYDICLLHNPYDNSSSEYGWLDIALIKINYSCLTASPPPVKLNLDKPRLGEYIYTFGYPRIQRGGDSCLLNYEGEIFNKEHWGDSIFKLRDSRIEEGMSGAPMYWEKSDSVYGIIQLSREYGGAKGLSMSTAVKYVPFIQELNKYAREEEKIWIELPVVKVRDIDKINKTSTRIHLFCILFSTSLIWFITNIAIRNIFNEAPVSPSKFSMSLACSCFSRENAKLIQTINKKIKKLDTEFIKKFGSKQQLGKIWLEIQEYLLIEMVLRRFSSKYLENQGRLLDVLDATMARRTLLERDKKKSLKHHATTLSFIQKSVISIQERLKPPLQETKQKSTFLLKALEQLNLWKSENTGLDRQSFVKGFREKVQEVIKEEIESITWQDISALKSLEHLIVFDLEDKLNLENSLIQEIDKYRGYGDNKTQTYHWNSNSCSHVDKLKHRLLKELINLKKGTKSEDEITVSGITSEEHKNLVEGNYEAGDWQKCNTCHNERKK